MVYRNTGQKIYNLSIGSSFIYQPFDKTCNDVIKCLTQDRACIQVELILGKDVNIEESEISEYFETNKEYFGVNSKIEEVYDQIKDELFKQKLSTEYTKWIEELKTKAKIKYIVNY